MPLTKLCARCGKVISYGHTLCPDCESKRTDNAKQYDRFVRDKRSAAFYHSKQWATLRNITMMQANYQCEVCRKQGKLMPADEVHHIIPIAVDWSKRLDRANLVCLCHKHHMEAHKKLEAGHGG
jgi:5-methylcytosine-specific restriction enzyme A